LRLAYADKKPLPCPWPRRAPIGPRCHESEQVLPTAAPDSED